MTSSDNHRIQVALNRAIELGEIGISVAVYHGGKLMIDAVAGHVERDGREVTHETLFPVFSVTKGITALALHIQVERGLVDLHAPIALYWPEFGAAGKENITVEHVLSHRSGVPQMPPGVTPELMTNWKWMTDQIALMEPLYPSNTANAYHILVWGWILGEVIRRTDPAGRPFEVFAREELLEPLRISPRDLNFGVGDDDLSRVAVLYGGEDFPLLDHHNISPGTVFPGATVHNLPIVQQTVDPSAGVIATAPAIARIFALLAEGGELDGVRLVSTERVQSFLTPRDRAHDPDKVVAIPVWLGKAGFWLGGEPSRSDPLVGEHREIIYSPGAGGSIAWADLQRRVAVAICHNNMDSPRVVEPERTFAPIVKAINEIIQDRESQEGSS
ncbi:predicted protein [Aspergillus terreus NIH2624]|uniref:Beta-lactamase-related domain-containing protein n=1 Tax=Aspergillus terreus (strain NIH 2624 / FGSC A1156) TaxID=341663 RepID=Q0C7Q5_ASPTN|nr:uncharacterized protein ATEG_10279 [Aspergillus terreus NIH2624]EAU29276.1 predicted protein [Aspergillus terreus NIH2624]